MRRYASRSAILACVFTLAMCAVSLHAQEAAKQEAEGIRRELESLQARLIAHGKNLSEEKMVGPGRYAEAFFLTQKAAGLAAGEGGGGYWRQTLSVERALQDAKAAVAALETPVALEPRVGFQERAYISEIDGALQPYFLYVPQNYAPDRAWPLLVFLHGYHSQLDALTWYDLMYSSTLQDICEREGVILLMPFGRSNTEFMGIGESDVLKTLGFVRDEYNVDPRRIILSGPSMGGSGAYSIACHHPDLWAGVVTITGRISYYEWMGIKKDSLPRFKQIQMDTDYALELLGNLQYVPVLIFHGELDETVKISQSRLMHRLMQERGQACEYIELEGMGHQGTWSMAFQNESFTRMLRNARSPEAPKSIRFRTFTIKYPEAYWVSVMRLKQWGEPADVSVQIAGENTLTVVTKNVAELRLGPEIPGLADIATVRIQVLGEPLERVQDQAGAIILRSPQAANLEEGQPKTSKLCGPIREVYDAPFVIVYPHNNTPTTQADRSNAGRLAQEWMAYARGRPRLLPDSLVDEDVIKKYNLILCGSPETNTVLADIADQLPIRITDDAYLVGERTFSRTNAGLQFIYPNPRQPDRAVLVVHGVQWGEKLQPNHKLDFLPDYIVYTDEIVEDHTWFPTNRPLCAGYFDSYWRLSESAMWLDKAENVPPQK